jgi:hypothetical protein
MASIPCKRSNNPKPIVALLSLATLGNEQIAHASRRHKTAVSATKIVNSLSESEVRSLPEETRQHLLRTLKAGRITNADRQAINKLLSCEVIELTYQQRMIIKGAKDFVTATKSHLINLSLLPIGRKLLNSIYKSGRQVMIIPADRVCEAPPEDFRAAIPKGKSLKWRELNGKEKTIKGSGLGSDTTIRYNPSFSYSDKTTGWRKYPPEIALAHELIHADDSAYGRLDPDEVEGVRNYERQAVGLSPYEDKEFTENKFRAAWATPIPLRMQY